MTECTDCGEDHDKNPFADMTEEELRSIDVENLLFPIIGIPDMGVSGQPGDEPQASIFFKMLGLTKQGEPFINHYILTPAQALRIATNLQSYVLPLVENPDMLTDEINQLRAQNGDDKPAYTGQYL